MFKRNTIVFPNKALVKRLDALNTTFVSFISYLLPNYDFPPKGELIIFVKTKSNVMNEFMYTLKSDDSPCWEISTSPTQRCVLQTRSYTSHDSMFRWSKWFKEAKTKSAEQSLHLIYVFHILKG